MALHIFFAGAFVTLPVGSPISPVDTEELVSLLPPNQKYPLEMTATFLCHQENVVPQGSHPNPESSPAASDKTLPTACPAVEICLI